jgi:uncharacterized protein (TIGR02145 family)
LKDAGIASAKQKSKIDICHKEGNGSSHTLNISINAWTAHQAHGDVRLDDQDGDGYVLDNDCSFGQMGDCNDLNAAINPGAPEICGNGIDENCNGQIDENCIPSVTICNQVWMLKNLDVSTYRDGTPIPQVQDPTAWANLTTGAWCYYDNNTANGTTYGKLYNWYAVIGDINGDGIKDKELAPVGWHIPSSNEWEDLVFCVGGYYSGEKLREIGTTHWLSPNSAATNSSGFTALPGGIRLSYFDGIGTFAYFWTTEQYQQFWARSWKIYNQNNSNFVWRFNSTLWEGLSVRCVKD